MTFRTALPAVVFALLAQITSGQTSDKTQALDNLFSAYEVIQLDPGDIERQVRQYEEPLAIEIAGTNLVFEMDARDLRSHRYRAEATGDDGLRRPLPLPEVDTFKGTAVGAPHIQGRFTITEDSFDGVVFTSEDWLYIEPLDNYLPDSEPAEMVAYRNSDIIHTEGLSCGASSLHHFLEQGAPKVEIGPERTIDFNTEYTVEVATEADYEFVREMGSVNGANRVILSILNRVEGVYENRLRLKLEVVYQHAWNTRNDPYSGTDARDLIDQFREHWNTNFSHETYDLAHLWSAKDLRFCRHSFHRPCMQKSFLELRIVQVLPGCAQISLTQHRRPRNRPQLQRHPP